MDNSLARGTTTPMLQAEEFSNKSFELSKYIEFIFEDKEVDESFLHRFEILSVLRVLPIDHSYFIFREILTPLPST